MVQLVAAPIAVLLVTLPFFLVAEYRRQRRRIFALKLVCSLSFVTIGVLALASGHTSPYGFWMLAGLLFSLLGDLALVWQDQRRPFLIGLVFFLTGHVLYTVALVQVCGLNGKDIYLFVALVAGALIAYRFLDMDLGRMARPVLVYLVIIALMLSKALSTLYLGGFSGAGRWLVPVGGGLFFLSDSLLALYKFQRRTIRALRGANLTCYYAGQVLLALSLWYA